MSTATARAGTNIALVKYWGKRDPCLNLPATSSLSMTLAGIGTTTTVSFDERLEKDELAIDGAPANEEARARASRLLDLVREASGVRSRASVLSANDVPTAAGLASSASGFAALALAAARAAGMDMDLAALAGLARRGSGSAPRSLLGGFVELDAGVQADGTDCTVRQVAGVGHWDLRMVIAVTDHGPKAVGSTEAMERTRLTSPFYPVWVAAVPGMIASAREAIAARDIVALGRVVEASCLGMHATAMAASPPILFWSGLTVALIREVWRMREAGARCFLTIDAGPHVKVLCEPADAEAVACDFARIPGVVRVIAERPGPGARVLA